MKTIYWAVLLDEKNRDKLTSLVKPMHDNVYAEHITLAFRPSEDVDKAYQARLGEEVSFAVTAHYLDDGGQAVSVSSADFKRQDGMPEHITISCAPGVKPSYSNELIQSSDGAELSSVMLSGRICKFTDQGWVCDSPND